jgi:Domain of unknown function (DUF397)
VDHHLAGPRALLPRVQTAARCPPRYRDLGIRNSKDPDGPVLRFTPGEWDAFLSGTLAGEFDQAGWI